MKAWTLVACLCQLSIARAGDVRTGPFGAIMLVDGPAVLVVQPSRPTSIIPKEAAGTRELIASSGGEAVAEDGDDEFVRATKANGVIGQDMLKRFDLKIDFLRSKYELSPAKSSNEQDGGLIYRIDTTGQTPTLRLDIQNASFLFELTYLTHVVAMSAASRRKLESLYEESPRLHGFEYVRGDKVSTWFEVVTRDNIPAQVDGKFGVDLLLDDTMILSLSSGQLRTQSRDKWVGVRQIIGWLLRGGCVFEREEFWVSFSTPTVENQLGKLRAVDGESIESILERYKTNGAKGLQSLLKKRRASKVRLETTNGEEYEITLPPDQLTNSRF